MDIEFTFFVQKGWTGMNLDRLALSAWKHDQSRFDPSNKIKIFDNRLYRTVLEYGFYGPLNSKCVCKILKKLLEYDAPVSQGNQNSVWLIGAFNRVFIFHLIRGGPWIPARDSLVYRFDEPVVSQVNCPRSVDDEDHTETIIDIFR